MTAPAVIVRLVERFEANREAYRSGKYNETQLRHEFLDKFFEALGWDINNEQGCAEAYKDVVHEDSLEVEGVSKAPDYAFRIGGTRKFFVEAKKPAVNIQYDIHPAFQLRRYAWSAKLPLSILSDFEEFAVYDSRSKPDKDDSAAAGRVMFLRYTDYLSKWDEIAGIFSKEAVLKGSFDTYAEGVKGKKGTQEIDDAFLEEIERWRTLLARNLALRNPGLQVRELNYAVQMTIDRIVFLRICEDREIEPENQLRELLQGEGVYERLCRIFTQADARYNSGLFHFAKEKGESSLPDDLTLRLGLDDKVLKEIVRDLYYPAPYVFKEIPADILGQVYERFLGKVIRLTDKHTAIVDEKPEVRKAGGVYYTPTYIVDYIVKNTVGKLLENKTPKEVVPLKIVDPACGSGSFLLGAFQYLLDWHTQWYCANEPESWAQGKNPALYQSQSGGWSLTTAEKKKILLNNIHGVDIDPQAVEVTKLSLSLKVLEGENEQTIGAQLNMFKERALPDLGRNIQCGNSLIGPDYYEGRQLTMSFVDEEERYRVNAFNWKAAFPQVFIGGGFDVVIGNPPYIRIQALQEWAPTEVEFYKKKYASARKGNYDIYVVFVEKGMSLLNERGRLGFILPHKFFNAQYGEPLRDLIAKGQNLAKVVHFGDQQVFENATTYTCLMFLDKTGHDQFELEKVTNIDAWQDNVEGLKGNIKGKSVTSSEWNFTLGDSSGIFEKLSQFPAKLSDIADRIYQGPITSADTIFLFKEFRNGGKGLTEVYSKELAEWIPLETKILKKVVRSGDIGRYWACQKAYVLFPYKVVNNAATLFSSKELQSDFPLTWAYLLQNKKKLESREKNAFKDMQWYRFGRTQNLGLWEQKKLLIPYMITNLSAYYDNSDNFYFINVTTGGYGITTDQSKVSYNYLCGLLNSRVLDFYLKCVSTTFHGGYFAANKQYIEQLPIPLLDSKNPTDIAIQNKLDMLVERMLELHKRSPRTPQEQEMVKREIESTDGEIDRLVYGLYGLTEEEVRIVEGK